MRKNENHNIKKELPSNNNRDVRGKEKTTNEKYKAELKEKLWEFKISVSTVRLFS